MNLKLTVALCTYNRRELLPRAIDSFRNQTWGSSELEILIIDNGSTDGTGELVAALQVEDNRIHYVVE